MDFREADRRYAELKRRYDNGDLSTEEFRAQHERIMVRDADGRFWCKHRDTGEWHYHDGSTWVQGTPPGDQSGGGSRRLSPWIAGAAGLVVVLALLGVVVWFLGLDSGSRDTLEAPRITGRRCQRRGR
jgi:hypothetical protein